MNKNMKLSLVQNDPATAYRLLINSEAKDEQFVEARRAAIRETANDNLPLLTKDYLTVDILALTFLIETNAI